VRLTIGHVLPELADGMARAAIKLTSPLVVFAAAKSDLVAIGLVAFIAGWVGCKVWGRRKHQTNRG
jgi:hypothetical protein